MSDERKTKAELCFYFIVPRSSFRVAFSVHRSSFIVLR